MTYVQIPERADAKAFLVLAKTGAPVTCLADNEYGVREEHLKVLKSKRIPFKKLNPSAVHLPKASLAA